MALINCPECGKEISDQAVSCPNCGCSMKSGIPESYKKQSGWGMIALIISFIPLINILSIIISIIDISKNNDEYRHTCSKLAIFISVVWLIVLYKIYN